MTLRKKFIGLIIGYFISQLLSMVVGLFLFLYIALYILSIIVGLVWMNKEHFEQGRLKSLKEVLSISFVANLILTLIYLKILYFNPKINWILENGGTEQDPWILLTYFPTIFFTISFLVYIIGAVIIKLKHKNIVSKID